MSELLKLGLRSQSVFSHIQLLVVIISRLVIIGLLQYTNVREAFSCVPKLNASTEQLCYDNYTSSYNMSFKYIFGLVDISFYFTWVFLAVYGAFVLRDMKRNRHNENYQWRWPARFMEVYFIVVVLRFLCNFGTIVMVSVDASVPSTYNCSVANDTAPIPFNKTETDFVCHDQHYKKKTQLNMNLVIITVFYSFLSITEYIYLKTFTPSVEFLDEVLGDAETSCELPATSHREDNLQDTPPSSGDQCDTPYTEEPSCGWNHDESADTHTLDDVLVSPPGMDKTHLVSYGQENYVT